MPEGTGPAETGNREVVVDAPADPGAADVLVHHDPVRIPFGAMPSAPVRPTGSSFALTFITGTAAAPWLAAALISRDPFSQYLALGWSIAFVVSLADDWRHRLRA